MDPTRARNKRNSAIAGYRLVFAADPTDGELRYLLAVGEHETQCGDGMRGDLGSAHNWGGVQWRVPYADELAATQDGRLHAGSMIPGGILRQDTRPGGQKYWVWFRAYPDDAHGAASLCATLYKYAPGTRLAAQNNGSPTDVATQMYLRGYFEGGHKGARATTQRSVPLTAPELANVTDYAAGLTAKLAAFSAYIALV